MKKRCYRCLQILTEESQTTALGNFHEACARRMFGNSKVPKISLSRMDILAPQNDLEKTRRMSISGMQPKVSIKLDPNNQLTKTDVDGTFILKPTPEHFPQASEGEQLGMLAAAFADIEVPPSALIRLADGELAYLVRRFDRDLNGKKTTQVEDMSQILNLARDDQGNFKYQGSYEFTLKKAREATGGKALTSAEFYKQVLLSFAFGNGDLHLKNFSVVKSKKTGNTVFYDGPSPAYDIVPTFLWLPNGSDLALNLLEEVNGSSYSVAYDALGFYSEIDFLELGRRLNLPEKTCLKYILGAINAAQKALLLAEEAGLFSEAFQTRFSREIEDRRRKLETKF